uniref:Uncharacterized protein n=2 Tax=unclassified Arthrobacter TaxID=235627 RepID=I3W191_9MICC|nr:hypothetical protein [Arthrobacter sp. J3.40]AFK89620.1 hypothetical protein [Arthrobacter sp. J3.53]
MARIGMVGLALGPSSPVAAPTVSFTLAARWCDVKRGNLH